MCELFELTSNIRDNFIKILSLKMKQKKLKNIFLLKDLSDNYSIQDQAYVALKSIGYILLLLFTCGDKKSFNQRKFYFITKEKYF